MDWQVSAAVSKLPTVYTANAVFALASLYSRRACYDILHRWTRR